MLFFQHALFPHQPITPSPSSTHPLPSDLAVVQTETFKLPTGHHIPSDPWQPCVNVSSPSPSLSWLWPASPNPHPLPPTPEIPSPITLPLVRAMTGQNLLAMPVQPYPVALPVWSLPPP